MTDKKRVIHWRSVQNIRWSQDGLFENVKEFLKTGEVPQKYDTYMKQYRFRKLYENFTLGDDGKIYLIIDDSENLPPYFLDENDNLLFDVKLPMRFRVIETQKEKDEIIKTYYSNLLGNNYRSSTNLHQRIMKEFLNISRKDVENYVKNLEIKQLIHPIEENKITKPIITERVMQQVQVDLIDVSNLAKHNDNVNFILTVIDIFSKFAWVYPLKNKSSKSIAYNLQQWICQEGSCEIIQSDNGAEFVNSDFVKLCQRFGIEHHTSLPYKPTSQGAVERFNGTIKNYIFRYLTDYKSKRYIDNLSFMVYSYNSTQHSTTRKTPFEIHKKRHESFKMLNDLVHKNISDNAEKMIEKSLKNQSAMKDELEAGDKVRVGLLFLKEGRRKQNSMLKKNKQHWSNEIYEVIDIKNDDDLISYKLDIPLKEEENRWFYRHQLLKVNTQELVKTKTVNDKLDLNFGEKFDSEQHIKNLAKNTAEQRMLEIPQDKLNEIVENQTEGENEMGRSKRQRKQIDKGFFVDF